VGEKAEELTVGKTVQQIMGYFSQSALQWQTLIYMFVPLDIPLFKKIYRKFVNTQFSILKLAIAD
jgi:hypothetical protein